MVIRPSKWNNTRDYITTRLSYFEMTLRCLDPAEPHHYHCHTGCHRCAQRRRRYQTAIDSVSSTKPRVSVCFIDQSTTLRAKRVLFPSGKIHFARCGFDVPEDAPGNDSNLLIVFYVQIMPDDFVMQLHRF